MKKKFLCALLAIMMIASLAACGNKQMFDVTAIVSLPDGAVISGKVESWTYCKDCDQIEVVIDGTCYLVHASNAAWVKAQLK